jgi:hypothetical protein
LSQGVIVPVARSLYLCEGHLGFANRKTDLVAIFDGIRPPSYPHVHPQFVAYARLSQGLGRVPFFLEGTFSGWSRKRVQERTKEG